MKRPALLLLLGFCLLCAALWSSCTRSESHFLQAGKGQLAHGDYARAILAFKNAAKLAPHDARPQYQMALAYEGTGNIPAAVASLQKAIRIDPKFQPARAKLAKIKKNKADLAQASSDLKAGRIMEAEKLFGSVAQRNPKDAEALLGLAVVELQKGKMDEAERIYRRISSIPAERYRPLHAEFLLHAGHPKRAIAELEQLVKQFPRDEHFAALLVSADMAAHRRPAAEQLLAKLLQENPKNREALVQQAKLYIKAGKLQQAQLDVNRILSQEADSFEAHYLEATIHRRNGEYLQARQELAKVLKLNPAYLPARVELANLLIGADSPQSALDLCNTAPKSQRNWPQLIVQRNRALAALGNWSELRAGIEKGLKVARTPALVLQQGELRLHQHDYAGARADARTVLSREPDNIGALNLLARTYTVQKQIPAAMEAVRTYAASRTSSVPVQQFYAEMLAANGNLDQSRAIFDRLSKDPSAAASSAVALAQIDLKQKKLQEADRLLTPLATQGNVPAAMWLAVVEARAKKFSAAIADYRRVLASDPENLLALNNLSFLLSEHGGDPAEALKFAQSAAQQDPENPDIEGTLAVALYRSGLYSQAQQYMKDALAKKDNAIRRYYLSLIEARLGESVQSRSDLQSAMRLDANAVTERQKQRQ